MPRDKDCPESYASTSTTDRRPVHRPKHHVDIDPSHDRLMRRPEVLRVTGLSRSSLYRLIASGHFSPPVSLGPNTVAWAATKVHSWIAERIASAPATKTTAKVAS